MVGVLTARGGDTGGVGRETAMGRHQQETREAHVEFTAQPRRIQAAAERQQLAGRMLLLRDQARDRLCGRR